MQWKQCQHAMQACAGAVSMTMRDRRTGGGVGAAVDERPAVALPDAVCNRVAEDGTVEHEGVIFAVFTTEVCALGEVVQEVVVDYPAQERFRQGGAVHARYDGAEARLHEFR